jgi:hypothetical protein
MDLMYLSTLDLFGSLILESRTSAYSSSQVSMDLPTCTHPVHNHPTYLCSLYTSNPCIVCTLYTDISCTPQKIGFSISLRISSSTLRATSDVHHFRCIHKYLHEYLHKKNRYTIRTSVSLMSELCFLFVSYVALHFPYFRSSPFKIISFCKTL